MTDPVFYLELELRLAPTMNELMRMNWRKAKRLSDEIKDRITSAKRDWPQWSCGARVETTGKIVRGRLCTKTKKHEGGRKRLIRVVRHTSGALDEPGSVDAIGGKLVTDALVIANVLRDDSEAWVVRDGKTAPAPKRRGLLTVEVFDV